MIEGVKPKYETQYIQLPLGQEILIRGVFCASSLSGLNLVELKLPEQNFSVIPFHRQFGFMEETGKNIDDFKMVIVGFFNGYSQKSAVQGFEEEEEQRTTAILPNSHELIKMMDIRK